MILPGNRHVFALLYCGVPTDFDLKTDYFHAAWRGFESEFPEAALRTPFTIPDPGRTESWHSRDQHIVEASNIVRNNINCVLVRNKGFDLFSEDYPLEDRDILSDYELWYGYWKQAAMDGKIDVCSSGSRFCGSHLGYVFYWGAVLKNDSDTNWSVAYQDLRFDRKIIDGEYADLKRVAMDYNQGR